MKLDLGRGMLFAVVSVFPVVALAVGPSTAPQTETGVPDVSDRHVWELTPYLKGNSSEIRELLNGEVERLAARVRETDAAIKRENIDWANDERDALARMHKTPAYVKAAADKAKAEADLETARKSGTTQDRLEASSHFNKLKQVLETFDHDAIVKSEDVSRDRQAVAEAQKELKRYNESLDKAVIWRSELLNDTRNGFMLKAPIVDGSKGTLPRVTVQKVIDGAHVIIEFDALTIDTSRPGKDIEGIKVFSATKSKVLLLVSGVDTNGLTKDDQTNFDRNFVINGTTAGDRGEVIFKADPSPEDVDTLFRTIVPLREPLPARFSKPPKDAKTRDRE